MHLSLEMDLSLPLQEGEHERKQDEPLGTRLGKPTGSLLAEVLLLNSVTNPSTYQFGFSSAKFLHNVFKLLGGEMAYGILLTLIVSIMHMHLL